MITKVQMINCQSIKNCMFDLSTEKLNVIIADNSTGKSVFFKMLKIATNPNYYSREERKSLIRRHTDCAMLYLKLDDGSLSCTAVYPTYTLYSYQKAGETTVKQSYEPDPEMLRKAGLLVNNSGEPFVANIVDSDQDLLLVNSKQKYNSSLVKMLVEHPALEMMKDKTHENSVRVANPLSSLTARYAVLEKAISESTYFDVAMREVELQTLEKGKDLLMEVIPIYNSIASIADALTDSVDYEFIEKALDVVEDVESLDLASLQTAKKPEDVSKELEILEVAESISLENLKIGAKPVDVTQELKLLMLLESIDLRYLQTIKKPHDLDNVLALLETLETLNLRQLQYGKEPLNLEPFFGLLQTLTEISQILVLCQSLLLSVHDIEQDLHKVEAELLNSGKMVECAIHGKVIYNGKECIPYSV